MVMGDGQYGGNTVDPNLLLAVSNSTWALKLCSNKIFQFLTGDAG